MKKLKMISLAVASSFALTVGGLTTFAVGPSLAGSLDATKQTTNATGANTLANPGAYGTTALSGTGMTTNTPGSPYPGVNNGSMQRTGLGTSGTGLGTNGAGLGNTGTGLGTTSNGTGAGVGAGIGANLGGLGVGIGANLGGTGTTNGMNDNARGNNNQMMNRMTTKGTANNGITGNYDTTPVRNYGVNTTANRNMNWGWLGLLGLVGLAGIRARDKMQSRQEANR